MSEQRKDERGRPIIEVMATFFPNKKPTEQHSLYVGKLQPFFQENQAVGPSINKVVLLPSKDNDAAISTRLFKPIHCNVVEYETNFRVVEIFFADEKPPIENPQNTQELHQLLGWICINLQRLSGEIRSIVERVIENEILDSDSTAVFVDWQNVYNYFNTLWGEEISRNVAPEMIKNILSAILSLPSFSKRRRTISAVYLFGYQKEFPVSMTRPNWSGYQKTEIIYSISGECENRTDARLQSKLVDVLALGGVDTIILVTGDGGMISSVELAKARGKTTFVIGPEEQTHVGLANAAHRYLELGQLIDVDNIKHPGLRKRESKPEENKAEDKNQT